MLVLSRKTSESINIGNNITVTVLSIQGRKVRLGLSAPPDVTILRSELERQVFLEADDFLAQTTSNHVSD